MKKSLIDILWEELKKAYYYRLKDIPEDKAFDMWSKYQCNIIRRIGEDSEAEQYD